MNRLEFMRQLEVLLTSVTLSEKMEALQYYNDYFDDAGAENEAEVIMALGTPARVAETIKAGLSGKNQEDWEFTETGFQNGPNRNREIVIRSENDNQRDYNYQNNNSKSNYNPNGYGEYEKQRRIPEKRDTGKIILIVVIAILFSPLWLSIAGAIFGAIVTVFALIAGLLFSIGAVAIALVIAGVAIFAASIVKLFVTPLLGVLLLGISLVLLGVGILFTIGTILLCGTVLPACVRFIVKICRLPFEKKKGEYA